MNLARFFKKLSSKKFKIKIVNNNKFKETTILKLNSQKSEKKLKWKNLINSKLMVRYTVDWYNEFLKNKLGLKITNKQINNFFK